MGCCGGGFSRRNFTQQAPEQAPPAPMRQESSLEALKTRLARGEITIDEYQQLRSVLLQDEPAWA